MKTVDIDEEKLSEGSGRCPENPQGIHPLTHDRALPGPVLAGRQEKGAVAPFSAGQDHSESFLSIDFRGISSQPAAPPVPVFHGPIDNSSAPVLQFRFPVCSGWSAGPGR